MATVGIRDLKTRLSECLRRVADGERLVVTDRGRPVAVISPPEEKGRGRARDGDGPGRAGAVGRRQAEGIDEDGAALARSGIAASAVVGSSLAAFVAAAAISAPPRLVHDFEADWDRYLKIELSAALVAEAARLADVHALHAYDAIHLASALASGSRRRSRAGTAISTPLRRVKDCISSDRSETPASRR